MNPVNIGPSWLFRRSIGTTNPIGGDDNIHKQIYSSYSSKRLWEVANDDNGGIFSLEFSPNGSMLVAACEKKNVVLFDPLNADSIYNIEDAHNSCVNCVKFIDNKSFATCSDDNTVALWDVRNLGEKLYSLEGHTNWVKSIEYSPEEKLLVTSGFDGKVFTWDVNSLGSPMNGREQIFSVNGLMRTRLSPDCDKMVLCTTAGYMIVVHNLELNSLAADLKNFMPNMYRLMQLSQTLLPNASYFTQMFKGPGKRNRLEFICDFPEGDEAEVLSSLQIHPHGHSVVSRNVAINEKSEWTCVHNIEERLDSDSSGDEEEEQVRWPPTLSPCSRPPSRFIPNSSDGIELPWHVSEEDLTVSPTDVWEAVVAIHDARVHRSHDLDPSDSTNPDRRHLNEDDRLAEYRELPEDHGAARVSVNGVLRRLIVEERALAARRSRRDSQPEDEIDTEEENPDVSPSTSQQSSFNLTSSTNDASSSTALEDVPSSPCPAERSLDGSQPSTSTNGSSSPATSDVINNLLRDDAGSSQPSTSSNKSSSPRINAPSTALGNGSTSASPSIQNGATSVVLDDGFANSLLSGTSSTNGNAPKNEASSVVSDDVVAISTSPAHHRNTFNHPSRLRRRMHGTSRAAPVVSALSRRGPQSSDSSLIGGTCQRTSPADRGISRLASTSSSPVFRRTRSRRSHNRASASVTDAQPVVDEASGVEDVSESQYDPGEGTSGQNMQSAEMTSDASPRVRRTRRLQLISRRSRRLRTHYEMNETARLARLNRRRLYSRWRRRPRPIRQERVILMGVFRTRGADGVRGTTLRRHNIAALTVSAPNRRPAAATQTADSVPESQPVRRPVRSTTATQELSRVRINRKIHQNIPRLSHYIEEPNVCKGFIKELSFSPDGRILCSPFGNGFRLLAFSPGIQDLIKCYPSKPVQLHELSYINCRSSTIVSTKFSPIHYTIASGSLCGKINLHKPFLG